MAGLRLQIRVSAPGLVGHPKGPIVPAISAGSGSGSGGSGGSGGYSGCYRGLVGDSYVVAGGSFLYGPGQ